MLPFSSHMAMSFTYWACSRGFASGSGSTSSSRRSFQEGLVVAPGFVLGRVVVNGVAGQRQIGHAIHVAVVGNGDGGHAQLNGTVDHILDTCCAVEHGEDSVVVQMDECHVMSSDAGSCSD